MAAEGAYPKANGDVHYASELNKVFYGMLGQKAFGTGVDGALHVTSGTTTISTMIKQYTSLIVDNGTTLAFSGFGKFIIYVQGNLTINGTLTIPDRAGSYPSAFDIPAGTEYSSTGQTGIGLAASIAPFPIFCVESAKGNNSGNASSVMHDGGGGGASYGNGGDDGSQSGGTGTPSTCYVAGGAGKAGILFIVGGNISFGSTAIVNGDGGAGTNGGDCGGYAKSGGGGGGGAAIFAIYGAGTCTLTAGATFNLRGGAGGYGGYDGSYTQWAAGGGGGGGGFLCICSIGTIANSATINVTGGVGGNNGVSGHGKANDGTAGAYLIYSAVYTYP